GPGAETWLAAEGGAALGWRGDGILATTVHGLLENDGLRAAVLAWAAGRAGLAPPEPSGVPFAAARQARLDRIADAVEAHVDLDRLFDLVRGCAPPPVRGASR